MSRSMWTHPRVGINDYFDNMVVAGITLSCILSLYYLCRKKILEKYCKTVDLRT